MLLCAIERIDVQVLPFMSNVYSCVKAYSTNVIRLWGKLYSSNRIIVCYWKTPVQSCILTILWDQVISLCLHFAFGWETCRDTQWLTM